LRPTIFEGAFAKLGGFLLELLNSPLVDTSALVNEMASRGGLARVDVADNYELMVISF